jgi:hypothetical protein
MKNLIVIFFLLIGVNVFSQINVDSIAFYMYEIHNEERTKNGASKRYLSSNCKSAAEIHLNYLMKYGFGLRHSEDKVIYGKKVLPKPKDRYDLFNKDSVLYKYADDYYVKKSAWVYNAEIATRQQINFNQNEVVSNKVVAERLMQNFKNSKAHCGSIIQNYSEYLSRGNFIGNYTTVIENDLVQHTFYCVAIFEVGYFLKNKTPYKGDYSKVY